MTPTVSMAWMASSTLIARRRSIIGSRCARRIRPCRRSLSTRSPPVPGRSNSGRCNSRKMFSIFARSPGLILSGHSKSGTAWRLQSGVIGPCRPPRRPLDRNGFHSGHELHRRSEAGDILSACPCTAPGRAGGSGNHSTSGDHSHRDCGSEDDPTAALFTELKPRRAESGTLRRADACCSILALSCSARSRHRQRDD